MQKKASIKESFVSPNTNGIEEKNATIIQERTVNKNACLTDNFNILFLKIKIKDSPIAIVNKPEIIKVFQSSE